MDLVKNELTVRILSVLRLDWGKSDVSVAPRPYNALSFRIRGDSEISNGEANFSLKNNDILFMPENVGYHLKSGQEEIIVIHFEIQGEKQNCFDLFTPQNPDEFSALFSEALNAWSLKKPGYYFRTLSVFSRILEKIARQEKHLSSPSYDQIKEAVLYMNEHYTDNSLSIFSLCKMVHMSDTYFRQLFFESYRTTPNKYLNNLRIDYAKMLLSSGYYSVERTAECCGFSDAKYFSSVFKRYCGCSPSAYRKSEL